VENVAQATIELSLSPVEVGKRLFKRNVLLMKQLRKVL